MNNQRMKSLNVLMVPWLTHGHVNRYLELGKRLAQQLNGQLSVHLCSTPVILDSIRDQLHQHSSHVNLVEFRLKEQPDLPSQLHTATHLPQQLLPKLMQAFAESEPTFLQLLDTLKPDIVIFDFFQPWAAKLAHQRNIQAALYIGCTVAISAALHAIFVPNKEFPFPAIKLTNEHRRQGPEDRYIAELMTLSWKLADFLIARSFREVESKYIDYLSTLLGKEVFTTGPLIPDVRSVSPGNAHEAEKVMHWLDRRERRSVVFVAFGSQYFMPYKEMEQLASGMELSGASFIWVARFPKNIEKDTDKEADDDASARSRALLHGLAERVGPERGLVVTSWAPQRKILLHGNLGCFLTHCGWSSVLEAMEVGVPMVALPMNWDQPANAQLIVDLGIGVEVPQSGLGNFKGDDVAACIKQILWSEHGEKVRRNAEDLAGVIRNRKDDDIGILADKIAQVAKEP